MKTGMSVIVGSIILVLTVGGVSAQTPTPASEPIGPPVKEQIPPPKEDPPLVELSPIAPAEDCEAPCNPGIRILWAETDVPVRTLVPREVIHQEKRKTLAVAYRAEKRVITEIVLKPCTVEKLVPCAVLKPVQVTDPVTGHCTTVMEPCTEMKLVKDTVYKAVPEQRTIQVNVPYLKEVDEVLLRRDTLLEYRTFLQKKPYPIAITHQEPQPKTVVAPEPAACEHP